MKAVAEESSATRKLREKIQRKVEKWEGKITKVALKEKVLEMHKWIAKHAKQRVILRNKSISLFDNNQNTARLSRKVAFLAKQLQEEDLSVIKSKKVLAKMLSSQKKPLAVAEER